MTREISCSTNKTFRDLLYRLTVVLLILSPDKLSDNFMWKLFIDERGTIVPGHAAGSCQL